MIEKTKTKDVDGLASYVRTTRTEMQDAVSDRDAQNRDEQTLRAEIHLTVRDACQFTSESKSARERRMKEDTGYRLTAALMP